MKSIKKITTLLLITPCIATLPACKKKATEHPEKAKARQAQNNKTHHSITADQIITLEEMNNTLANINNLESAKKALPKLISIKRKLKMIQTDKEKIAKPTNQITREIKEKFGAKKQQLGKNITQTMKKIKQNTPKAYNLLQKALN